MTDKLKVVAAIREALAGHLTPGPWRWWTSNSFRRLSSDTTGKDGDVLYAFNNRSDNHPDICVSEGDAALIAACNPEAITTVLDALDAALERVKVLEADARQVRAQALEEAAQIVDSAIDGTLRSATAAEIRRASMAGKGTTE